MKIFRSIQKVEKNCMLCISMFVISAITLLMVACGSDGDDGDGESAGEPRCDVVANANASAFFKVINRLDNGLAWYFSDGSYAFGADMQPNECTIFGLGPGGYTVTFQQCNIGSSGCASDIGSAKNVVFSVQSGETYTVDVNVGFF